MRMYAAFFGSVAAFAAFTASAINFDALHPIYDATTTRHSVDQLPQVLNDVYAKNKPVLFYVHGRGDEPTKSFDSAMTRGGALPRLEREYGVTVVMVKWNLKSKTKKDRAIPLANIPQAAAAPTQRCWRVPLIVRHTLTTLHHRCSFTVWAR